LDNEGHALIQNLPWIKPLVPTSTRTNECAYYMLLNLMHYFHAKQWGIDVIIEGGKWYKRKDIEEVHAKKKVFIEEE
jgi:hypothetical protein